MNIRVTTEGKTNETTLDDFLSLHDDLDDAQIEIQPDFGARRSLSLRRLHVTSVAD
jgi:hypothetical protein